jgi:hypothetical protein
MMGIRTTSVPILDGAAAAVGSLNATMFEPSVSLQEISLGLRERLDQAPSLWIRSQARELCLVAATAAANPQA